MWNCKLMLRVGGPHPNGALENCFWGSFCDFLVISGDVRPRRETDTVFTIFICWNGKRRYAVVRKISGKVCWACAMLQPAIWRRGSQDSYSEHTPIHFCVNPYAETFED